MKRYPKPLKEQIKAGLRYWSEAELMAFYSNTKLPKEALELITNELLRRTP